MRRTTVAPHCIAKVVVSVLLVCRAVVLVYPFAARSASTAGSISCSHVYWINCATVCLPRCRAASCDRHHRVRSAMVVATSGGILGGGFGGVSEQEVVREVLRASFESSAVALMRPLYTRSGWYGTHLVSPFFVVVAGHATVWTSFPFTQQRIYTVSMHYSLKRGKRPISRILRVYTFVV